MCAEFFCFLDFVSVILSHFWLFLDSRKSAQGQLALALWKINRRVFSSAASIPPKGFEGLCNLLSSPSKVSGTLGTHWPIRIGDFAECQRRFTMNDVLAFAAVSGDTNPIHINPEAAKQSHFGKCIVHGWLTASLFGTIFASAMPGSVVSLFCILLSSKTTRF